MKSVSKEDLVPLLNIIEELETFLESLRLNQMPYFVRFLDRMKYNLMTCITIGYLEWENIDVTLKRDWKEANDTFLGIPDFEMPGRTPEEKIERTYRFFGYVKTIDAIVTGEK